MKIPSVVLFPLIIPTHSAPFPCTAPAYSSSDSVNDACPLHEIAPVIYPHKAKLPAVKACEQQMNQAPNGFHLNDRQTQHALTEHSLKHPLKRNDFDCLPQEKWLSQLHSILWNLTYSSVYVNAQQGNRLKVAKTQKPSPLTVPMAKGTDNGAQSILDTKKLKDELLDIVAFLKEPEKFPSFLRNLPNGAPLDPPFVGQHFLFQPNSVGLQFTSLPEDKDPLLKWFQEESIRKRPLNKKSGQTRHLTFHHPEKHESTLRKNNQESPDYVKQYIEVKTHKIKALFEKSKQQSQQKSFQTQTHWLSFNKIALATVIALIYKLKALINKHSGSAKLESFKPLPKHQELEKLYLQLDPMDGQPICPIFYTNLNLSPEADAKLDASNIPVVLSSGNPAYQGHVFSQAAILALKNNLSRESYFQGQWQRCAKNMISNELIPVDQLHHRVFRIEPTAFHQLTKLWQKSDDRQLKLLSVIKPSPTAIPHRQLMVQCAKDNTYFINAHLKDNQTQLVPLHDQKIIALIQHRLQHTCSTNDRTTLPSRNQSDPSENDEYLIRKISTYLLAFEQND